MAKPVQRVDVYSNHAHSNADDYGQVGGHFDMPGDTVVLDDALTGFSYDFASDGGAPRPYAFVSNESSEQFAQYMPGNEGNRGLAFENAPALIPQTDYVSQVPAAGSTDLAMPRDTPNFGPGTNRIIRSNGPVAGTPEDAYAGQAQVIGREQAGQDGPVSGDANGYSWQLAMATNQALAQQYSAEAALNALVSAV